MSQQNGVGSWSPARGFAGSGAPSSSAQNPASTHHLVLEPRTPRAVPGVRGRHRKRAEWNRVNHEIRLLQEELQLAEKSPPASKACKDYCRFIKHVEDLVDPFLPHTSGTINPSWNRWFETPAVPNDCLCWAPWKL